MKQKSLRLFWFYLFCLFVNHWSYTVSGFYLIDLLYMYFLTYLVTIALGTKK